MTGPRSSTSDGNGSPSCLSHARIQGLIPSAVVAAPPKTRPHQRRPGTDSLKRRIIQTTSFFSISQNAGVRGSKPSSFAASRTPLHLHDASPTVPLAKPLRVDRDHRVRLRCWPVVLETHARRFTAYDWRSTM